MLQKDIVNEGRDVQRHIVVTRGGQVAAATTRLQGSAGEVESADTHLALLPVEAAQLGADRLVVAEQDGNEHELLVQPAAFQRNRIRVVPNQRHGPRLPVRARSEEVQGVVPARMLQKYTAGRGRRTTLLSAAPAVAAKR